MNEGTVEDTPLLIGEAQVLLAEKRTSLSAVRTGIALIALPLSITSLLIATSKMYATADVVHLLVPVLAVCLLLGVVGLYLILRSVARMRYYDRKLSELKSKDAALAQLFDS